MIADLSPTLWIILSIVLGLVVGSFLNVVIYRVPKMMELEWEDELALASGKTPPEREHFSLWLPRSHCPHCNNTIRWFHNVPVLSWILLKGRCAYCNARVSAVYPIVEISCAILFGILAYLHPPAWSAVSLMALGATLLALAMIDFNTFLLPDSMTLPLVWAGLLYNLVFKVIPLNEAVIGAMLGYLMLWTVYKVFKALTGKEGMGYGDFKLLAAAGAWFGPLSLVTILLVASLSGIVFGLILQAIRKKSRAEPFPFGPCLVLGALTWMLGFNLANWI